MKVFPFNRFVFCSYCESPLSCLFFPFLKPSSDHNWPLECLQICKFKLTTPYFASTVLLLIITVIIVVIIIISYCNYDCTTGLSLGWRFSECCKRTHVFSEFFMNQIFRPDSLMNYKPIVFLFMVFILSVFRPFSYLFSCPTLFANTRTIFWSTFTFVLLFFFLFFLFFLFLLFFSYWQKSAVNLPFADSVCLSVCLFHSLSKLSIQLWSNCFIDLRPLLFHSQSRFHFCFSRFRTFC